MELSSFTGDIFVSSQTTKFSRRRAVIPNLLELGPIPVRSFGLMVALALFAGALRLAISFKRYGIDQRLAERYVTAAGISGLLGARLWFIAENWSHAKLDLFGALFSSAGFTFYGGFIIAALVVYIMAKRDGTDVAKLCDALGPCLALGYAVGRLGCQLSGDGDYGLATTSWFGMSYATGVVPTLPGELVYPTPLLESSIALVVLWILSAVEVQSRYLTGRFQRFGLYLALISIERFVVEFLRVNERIIAGLSEAQVIAIGLGAFGVVLLAAPWRALSREG
jgi:phosphatidylglycerol:prolipoprotein diacylglycerol transferase